MLKLAVVSGAACERSISAGSSTGTPPNLFTVNAEVTFSSTMSLYFKIAGSHADVKVKWGTWQC